MDRLPGMSLPGSGSVERRILMMVARDYERPAEQLRACRADARFYRCSASRPTGSKSGEKYPPLTPGERVVAFQGLAQAFAAVDALVEHGERVARHLEGNEVQRGLRRRGGAVAVALGTGPIFSSVRTCSAMPSAGPVSVSDPVAFQPCARAAGTAAANTAANRDRQKIFIGWDGRLRRFFADAKGMGCRMRHRGGE